MNNKVFEKNLTFLSTFLLLVLPVSNGYAEDFRKVFDLPHNRHIVVEEVTRDGRPVLRLFDSDGTNLDDLTLEIGGNRLSLSALEIQKQTQSKKHWKKYNEQLEHGVPLIGEPLQLELETNNESSWGYLNSLYPEARAIVEPFIETFAQQNIDSLSELLNTLEVKAIEASKTKKFGQSYRYDLAKNTLERLIVHVEPPEVPDPKDDPKWYIIAAWNKEINERNRAIEIRKQRIQNLRSDVLEGRVSPPDRSNISMYHKKPLETPLIVVHPGWDGVTSDCSEHGVALEDLVAKFRELEKPVAVLVGGPQLVDKASYQVPTKIWNARDVALYSLGGEHCFRVASQNVVVAGIYLEACLHRTMEHAIDNYFQNSIKKEKELLPFTIHLPDRAVWSINGDKHESGSTIEERIVKEGVDEFYQKYIKQAFRSDGKFRHLGEVLPKKDISRIGAVFLDEYQFHISIYGKEFPPIGKGKRIVNLKIWPHDQFMKEILPELD